MNRKAKELRCFCRGEPLLATYGVDSTGKLYVHVKIFKQNRIYGELIINEGTVKMRCRNCLRWHRVIFNSRSATLTEDQSVHEPVVID
jgi:hypothetical protein